MYLSEVPIAAIFTETESRTVEAVVAGEERRKGYYLIHKVAIWEDEKLLEKDGDGCTTTWT